MAIVTEDHEYCFTFISKVYVSFQTLWYKEEKDCLIGFELVCQSLRNKDKCYFTGKENF